MVDLSCRARGARTILFVLNILFLMFGFTILGLGIYVKVNGNFSTIIAAYNITQALGGAAMQWIGTTMFITRQMECQLKDDENSHCLSTDQQEKNDYDTRISMNKNDIKRIIIPNIYKPLNETEFLSKTHSEIKQEFHKMSNPPAKDTHAAKDEKNLDKSRYQDVIPGELTRVKLQPDIDDKNDFINANYVSGYNNQEKAYIFTQGPLQTTVKDFWRMIWQENISIIVMTTNIIESGIIKCYPYWPSKTKEYLNTGLYQIENENSDEYDSFIITKLLLKKKNNSEIRTIYHAHYLKWPDYGIPTGTKDVLLFLEKVEYYKELTMTKSPILLHCSAGIGRTGTFCTIDISIKQYLNEKTLDIPSIVVKMRHERAGSVQTEDQYLFAYLVLMDFIKEQKAIRKYLKNAYRHNQTETINIIEQLEREFKCCGVKSYLDYTYSGYQIPKSCYRNQIPTGIPFDQGCETAVAIWIWNTLPIIADVLGSILFIEISGVISSLVLGIAISHAPNIDIYYRS